MTDISQNQPPARDEKGRLLPGHTANPSGENGVKGYALISARQDYFLDKYTAAEIKRIVTDERQMENFSMRDWQILTHLAGTVAGKDKGKERERLYDRQYGKAIQTVVMPQRQRPSREDIDNCTEEEVQAAYDRIFGQ